MKTKNNRLLTDKKGLRCEKDIEAIFLLFITEAGKECHL